MNEWVGEWVNGCHFLVLRVWLSRVVHVVRSYSMERASCIAIVICWPVLDGATRVAKDTQVLLA